MTTPRSLSNRCGLAALAFVVAACGGDASTKPLEPRLQIAHVYGPWGISPSGAQDLVLVSPDGATSRTLFTLAGSELSPEWSPDGKQLLFARYGDDRAWIVDEDGSNAHPLTAIRGLNFRWSPDGQWIVYSRVPASGSAQIVIVRPNGTDERVVGPQALDAVSWSPDGRIVFRVADQFGLWTVRSDGTELTRLTTLPSDWYPRWSPDGSRLLAERWDGVMVMDADGSNRRYLTSYSAEYWDDLSSWSPDGQWILFARHWKADDSCAVFKVPVGGGDLVAVVDRRPSTGCNGASWRR
jgi:Tol biopolymer transport system component